MFPAVHKVLSGSDISASSKSFILQVRYRQAQIVKSDWHELGVLLSVTFYWAVSRMQETRKLG